MSVKMKFGSKDIPFVYKGDKLIYPNPIKDGLLLWYDFKGIRNTDTNKEVAKDLSGNGNDGTLTNFNFTEGSGYKDNTLVFDGVDDSLTIPELVLDETAMSVVQDGKLYTYEDDKVVAVNKHSDGARVDLEGLEVGGRNHIVLRNTLVGYYNHEVGNVSRNDAHSATGLIPVEYPNKYIYSTSHGQGVLSYPRVVFFDKNKEFISGRVYGQYEYGVLIEPTEGVAYVGLSADNREERSGGIEKWKLERGTIATSWSPAPEDFQTTSLSPSSLSNLQLYNRPLRKDELLHNAESKGLKKLKPGVVVQDGLVLHYDFSHESNTSEYKDKAFDYSGNGNHGTLQNFGYAEGSGYEGKGLKFDGVDDYIVESGGSVTTDILGINTIHDTVSFTVKANEDKRNNLLYASEILKIDVYGTYIRKADISPNLTTNHDMMTKPVSVSYVRYDGGIKVYIDGELDSDNPYDNEKFKELQLYNIGYYVPVGRPSVELYDVKIYSRPLTAEEIAHNYQIEKEKYNLE